ncbi:Protein of unknown function [Lysobacter enzymogenes]|nr:Protein of unknown function [Lysobacter enzymogenes]
MNLSTSSDLGLEARPRFIDNDDGTITDTVLRLIWSKATLCGVERVSYAEAAEACKALGQEWRLPTRVELFQLVDDTRCSPAIDTAAFPDTMGGAYWTATEYALVPLCVRVVGFISGRADGCHRDEVRNFVRAVRSLPAST